jgi:hypothetical protein
VCLFVVQSHPKQLIFFNLRTELKKIDGHEDVLIEMLQQCVDFLERGIFVTPDDKYRLLRSLPHLMLLMDGEKLDKDNASFNVFKSKKLKLEPLKVLFKQYPVLPMYGDMPIRPEVILQRAPHYDVASMGAAWGGLEDKATADRYQIKGHWQPMRRSYDDLLARLTVTVNEVTARQAQGAALEKDMGSVVVGQRVAALVVECFNALREWSCRVQEMIAWKMSYPASEEDLAKQKVTPEDRQTAGFNYERCVRYNYNMMERSMLVDVVTMIKALATALRRAETKLAPLVTRQQPHIIMLRFFLLSFTTMFTNRI